VGWNLAVEDVILKQLEGAGKGRTSFYGGSDIAFVILTPIDPWNEVDGERGSIKSRHPAFTDKAVRDAMNLLIDRKGIQEVIYGRGAITTSNFLNNPSRFVSKNTKSPSEPIALRNDLLRRLLIALPSLLGISLVLFTVLALAPGDPFEELASNPNVPAEVRTMLRQQMSAGCPRASG
jgi:hypothetical protein